MKRPKDLKLLRYEGQYLKITVGEKGQSILYLKPDGDTPLYIQGRKKINQLERWIKKAVQYTRFKN